MGAWICVELIKRYIGLKRSTGDLFVLPLIASMVIGRIGCFLTGYYDKTYGIPTSLWWAVDFGDGILRHPTQLYEITFLVFLGVSLLWVKKRPYPEGALFRYFMIGYFTFRFWVEFLKPWAHVYYGLNGTQLVSLGVILYYGIERLYNERLDKKMPAPFSETVKRTNHD